MENNEYVIDLDDLKSFCTRSLCREGMSQRDAQITATVLAETDAFGTHSHGTKNLYDYIKKIRVGGITLNQPASVIMQGAAFAVIDAHAAIGMVPAYNAVEIAMEKARSCGIGMAIVTNATHFGAAGYYANMAARNGMIGISMSNVDPNMTIPGARSKVIGNNPIAYAVPNQDPPSIFLDIALSSVASLKVVQAKKDHISIPDSWIVDSDGLPTTDPSSYPDGCAMQPMAAHKGYGLALMVDLLTGLLVGGGSSITGEIQSWLFHLKEPNHVTHTFIVIDPNQFVGQQAYLDSVSHTADVIHQTPKAKGAKQVFVPGEIEWRKYQRAEKEGVHLPPDVAESLKKLSQDNGIPLMFANLS